MEKKYKDERQFAGTTFKTAAATPDGAPVEDFTENDDLHVAIEIPHYKVKIDALNIAIEFARLTDGPSVNDVIRIGSLFAKFIVNKNNQAS